MMGALTLTAVGSSTVGLTRSLKRSSRFGSDLTTKSTSSLSRIMLVTAADAISRIRGLGCWSKLGVRGL